MNISWKKRFLLIALIAVSLTGCRKPEAFNEEAGEELSAGDATVFDESSGAFGHVIPFLSGRNAGSHELGDKGFGQTFVAAPAPIHQGLGPLYISNSCISCHISDGRGRPPLPGEQPVSMLFRISVPGSDEHGGPLAAPGYGVQLQTQSSYGKKAEAQIIISYIEQQLKYADGSSCSLREPNYNVQGYTAMPATYYISPRIAPPVFGLGLLEAVDESTILAKADPQDMDKDGISGRPNYVWDAQAHSMKIGRFGWKANNPTLLQQTAGAFNEDMGITSSYFGKENCENQAQYDEKECTGIEIPDTMLRQVAFYTQSLGVPARRNVNDLAVKHGKQLFTQIKCAACHRPEMRTAVNVAFPEVSNKLLRPYTDLLLHDMGPGLADNRPDYSAGGQEWRTPPLWGVGLTRKVNGHTFFLHDGRARSLEEAILWHGGEASSSKEQFRQLSKEERNDLIRFLESL